ncbi:hypothetical protein GCM10010441_46210 [Kitasatospora paracochleata]|uniref:WD40 repeat protein n=1 Tax=Kitasatospora paracochleata TaxID=58354 RepID=A0ABT1J6E2_9ACTN|nr:hypothetical protein [Kitasatospora paracochleata]MCP2312963.1 hypothetical protein [Kitasatospora paracochleata]
MSSRARLRTASAIALTVAVSAGTLLLTACDPADPAGGASAPAATASAAPTAQAAGSGKPSAPAGSASPSAKPAPSLNNTAHNGLTISNGTRYVLMNGTRVDFGTEVRDLAWSPDGGSAAFVDGSGDLVVAKPDGSGRAVVAKNPGGQTWSHPTWQVSAADEYGPARSNLFFTAEDKGVLRLMGVESAARGGAPHALSLGHESGDNVAELPQTGNLWPSGGGEHGSAVYANRTTGQVYIRDDYLRQQGNAIGPGSEPALSPHGDDVVFVRSVNGHSHIFELGLDGKPAKDLTPQAAADYTEPAFSADGRTLAVRAADGVYTLPLDGSAAPTRVSDTPGLPAYRR